MIEYRVVWRRAERRRSTRIYQGRDAAYRKAQGILAVERIKDEFDGLASMPELVEPPVIQTRTVGEWEDWHTPDAPTEWTVECVRSSMVGRFPERNPAEDVQF